MLTFNRTASYVRKYWTEYLSMVQPGNQEILAALKRFERSTKRLPLTIDEIKAVWEWLEVQSRITLSHAYIYHFLRIVQWGRSVRCVEAQLERGRMEPQRTEELSDGKRHK